MHSETKSVVSDSFLPVVSLVDCVRLLGFLRSERLLGARSGLAKVSSPFSQHIVLSQSPHPSILDLRLLTQLLRTFRSDFRSKLAASTFLTSLRVLYSPSLFSVIVRSLSFCL